WDRIPACLDKPCIPSCEFSGFRGRFQHLVSLRETTGHFQGIRGLFRPMLLSKREQRERDGLLPRCPHRLETSPAGLSLSMVACLQSPPPFHPVWLSAPQSGNIAI